MAQAIVARRDGDTFQARLFWGRAARLLDPRGAVARVGFECGPAGFDDIWVEYEPGRGPLDQHGEPLKRVHMQCKWHVSPGAYGYADLINPEFINAQSRSLLQRAQNAQATHALTGAGVRFQLTTNWTVNHQDPLRGLIASRSSALIAQRLFDGSTDRSKLGQVRKLWRDHLGVDDTELAHLAGILAFGQVPDSLDALREHLEITLRLVGLHPVAQNESAFVYDDIVFQWLGQGRLEFDRASFKAACLREGVLGPAAGGPKVYGVKSFEHPFDGLEERCDEVLDMVRRFDERYIQRQEDWAGLLYPELKAFLLAAGKESERLRLILDAHVTLAFAAGSVLHVKSGRHVELEQRTLGRQIWSADDVATDPAWPNLETSWTELDPTAVDVAVAIGLTHDVASEVLKHVEAYAGFRGVLVCRPSSGTGARSVTCGAHASALADGVLAAVRARRPAGGRCHLFIAAPNAFSFMLGQRRVGLGPTTLYEFDFDGARGGGYQPSLAVPIAAD
jgi:hypothetical protein